MNRLVFLIDTNILFRLETDTEVSALYAEFARQVDKHDHRIYIYSGSEEDIKRDKDPHRRSGSLSKIKKFVSLGRIKDISKDRLESQFGNINKENDRIDVELLFCLQQGACDFLVTEDRGLHKRARTHAPALSKCIVYLEDAVSLLQEGYEEKKIPLPYVEEVAAHQIPVDHELFETLKRDYPGFTKWWKEKCARQQRTCWIVTVENEIYGIIVRKEEDKNNTDARTPAQKILKICTFKIDDRWRGIKLGELLLKKAIWFAHQNKFDLIYLTCFAYQERLRELIEYFGFSGTGEKSENEIIYEKELYFSLFQHTPNGDRFTDARIYFPQFYFGSDVQCLCIPIRPTYHEELFPELRSHAEVHQPDLFGSHQRDGPKKPGNTIRKVYLCRTPRKNFSRGAVLFFYKGKADRGPSQCVTTVGILEDVHSARSTLELMRLTGGRSVFSEQALDRFGACPRNPVKVLNFLLVGHLEDAVGLEQLKAEGVFKGSAPQSICERKRESGLKLVRRLGDGFEVNE